MTVAKQRDRAAIEAQLAELQAELDAAGDDDDIEIWTEHEINGKTVRGKLTGSHGRRFVESIFGSAAPGTGGDGGDDQGDDGTDDDDQGDDDQGDPAPRNSVWGRK